MSFIVRLLLDIWHFQFKNVSKGIIASFINVFIYLIIAILIIGLSQGSVLPIDMFVDDSIISTAVNISLFHMLIYFLALIMSLYPHYIYLILFGSEEELKNYNWSVDRLGLIYYYLIDSKKSEEDQNVGSNPYFNEPLEIWTTKFLEKAIRKFLAVFLFIVWVWLLIKTYCEHQINERYNTIIVIVGILVTIVFLIMFYYITVVLKRYTYKTQNIEAFQRFVRILYKWHIPVFIGILILHITLVYYFQWSMVTLLFQIGICLFLSIYLTFIRSFRKLISARSHILEFLSGIRRIGIVVIIFLLGLNLSTAFSNFVNPINILLAGLITFYTILTMIIKIYIYLNEKKYGMPRKNLYNWIYFGIIIFFSCFFGYNLYNGNNLHKLQLKERTPPVSLSSFYNAYNPDTTYAPILYAAYGGGLKAHYWNYLILDKMDKKKMFSNILAMSGVSGGGMGLANYTAMKYLELDADQREAVINEVRGSNILGIEMAWLFGADLLRELLPPWNLGQDRSHRSMTFYNDRLKAQKSGFDLVNDITFDEVYSSLHKKSHYPNLIINSTATTSRSGVVSAIRTDNMFPGTTNILDIYKDKTLTYFEAASTCNRFPYVSPAANIENVGHFVDGGYYENSGVMSLISFKSALLKYEKQAIKKDSSHSFKFKYKLKLLSVRNDKGNYIQSLMNLTLHENANLPTHMVSNEDFTETGAIISSFGNLERTPTYLRELIKEYHSSEYELNFVDLPYYIREGDVQNHYGGQLNKELSQALQININRSNEEIKRLLRGNREAYDIKALGVVNPPTARILSKPVEYYMEQMMEHYRVRDQMESLLTSKSIKMGVK